MGSSSDEVTSRVLYANFTRTFSLKPLPKYQHICGKVRAFSSKSSYVLHVTAKLVILAMLAPNFVWLGIWICAYMWLHLLRINMMGFNG